MKIGVRTFPQWGQVLWVRTNTAELGIALDFGIRIVHLSCPGMENLYYEQPEDLSDGFAKENGWRLYGGHRMWLAPEGADSYAPDNKPIRRYLGKNSVLLEQQADPALGIIKQLHLESQKDGSIIVTHEIKNISDSPITGASWGINTLDAGGSAEISFSCGTRGGYNPKRTVSLWSDTNLHDPRLKFEKDKLTAIHMPLPDYLKLGLYAQPGVAIFRNKGQQFQIAFDASPMQEYPDNGCNFELYMNSRFMELETLGRKTEILPGQTASHKEIWQLSKL